MCDISMWSRLLLWFFLSEVLQRVACDNKLQETATHCNVLQHMSSVSCTVSQKRRQRFELLCARAMPCWKSSLHPAKIVAEKERNSLQRERQSFGFPFGDCLYCCSWRNNVVVLFETLKVQSFMLTEVRDCDLLIVIASSTFLKRKDMLKEKSS